FMVSVKDDNGTPANPADDFFASPVLSGGFNVGDANMNNLLDPGETWAYSASGTALNLSSPPAGTKIITVGSGSSAYPVYENTGTVTATENNVTLTSSDIDHYRNPRPAPV